MEIIKEISEMQKISDYQRCESKKIALVPTMGYLHQGHVSLMQRAKKVNQILTVSIFVNPTQFGKNEDFDKYPRDFGRDMDICNKAGADYVFAPGVNEMYKDNDLTDVFVKGLSDKLEGEFRPGHFKGVTTVVLKLLNAVKPDNLYLGQKDAQQNVIIRKMISDLNVDTKLIICDTVREDSGLAMSSRNSYLKEDERKKASVLYFLLLECRRLILQEKVIDSKSINGYIRQLLKERTEEIHLEYLQITDNEDLNPIEDLSEYKGEILVSLSAKVRDVRLIDNIIFIK